MNKYFRAINLVYLIKTGGEGQISIIYISIYLCIYISYILKIRFIFVSNLKIFQFYLLFEVNLRKLKFFSSMNLFIYYYYFYCQNLLKVLQIYNQYQARAQEIIQEGTRLLWNKTLMTIWNNTLMTIWNKT